MHSFDELIDRSISFSLQNLDKLEKKILADLQTSASTILVKNLQMVSMQRVIMAVGILSIFEAHLQDRINCVDGFQEARKLLIAAGECSLDSRFGQFVAAINVLKHGRGRSYDMLLSQFGNLPFRMKGPNEFLFFEGEVSEISTLIQVDKKFILQCASIIRQVSVVVQQTYP